MARSSSVPGVCNGAEYCAPVTAHEQDMVSQTILSVSVSELE
jgi:hypothetical protein